MRSTAALAAILLTGCAAGASSAPADPETVTVTETVTVEAEPEPAETVTVVETEYVTAEPVDRTGAYQTVRDVFQGQLDRQPSLDELQWGVEFVVANGVGEWMAAFADEYGSEADWVDEREQADDAAGSVGDSVRVGSCMSNPDQPRCDD